MRNQLRRLLRLCKLAHEFSQTTGIPRNESVDILREQTPNRRDLLKYAATLGVGLAASSVFPAQATAALAPRIVIVGGGAEWPGSTRPRIRD